MRYLTKEEVIGMGHRPVLTYGGKVFSLTMKNGRAARHGDESYDLLILLAELSIGAAAPIRETIRA